MPVTIRNMERRMKVINLPHEAFCGKAGKCSCAEKTVTTVVQDPRTGERNQVSRVKRIPSSLTILSLETRTGLPDAVLEVPEVKRGLRAGRLRVVEQRSDVKPNVEPAVVESSGGGQKKKKERDQ